MRGLRVTLISDEHVPHMARLGEDVGKRISNWLVELGVRLQLGAGVDSLDGGLVRVPGNPPVEADVVLMASGVRPRGKLGEDAGLETEKGRVLTDEHMRASADGVFAVGDIALATNAAAGRRLHRRALGRGAQPRQGRGAHGRRRRTACGTRRRASSRRSGRRRSSTSRGATATTTLASSTIPAAPSPPTTPGRQGGRRAHPRARRGLRGRARAGRAGQAAAVTVLPAPDPALLACVVVPARDEEELVGGCIAALAAQRGVAAAEYEVLLVLDRCTDATEARARAAAGAAPLHVLRSTGAGVGAARALGMDLACERLHAVGRPDGLIACTDADSQADAGLAARAAGRGGGGRAGRSAAGRPSRRPRPEALPAGVRERRERRRPRPAGARPRAPGHGSSTTSSPAPRWR